MEDRLVYPIYYRIVRREGDSWYSTRGSIFYAPSHKRSQDWSNPEKVYGTTLGKIAINLFRINGGREGYYLANIRDRLYYYCGQNKQDVQAKLHELGIGRPDPLES